MKKILLLVSVVLALSFCKKDSTAPSAPAALDYLSAAIDGQSLVNTTLYNVNRQPVIRLSFSAPLDTAVVAAHFMLKEPAGTQVPVIYTYEHNDSTVLIQTTTSLKPITRYVINLLYGLKSSDNRYLQNSVTFNLITAIDSSDKFPRVSDSVLLDKVQAQTFRYFWDFGHPVSGLARERNTSGDVVTTGGSGFGIMSVLVGIQRHFITRTEGLSRLEQIVDFLTNKAQRYHGAFPHWMNGATGATIPFSPNDDGADLVETAYMMQGLLCARQYFNSTTDAGEVSLRAAINQLWDGVEWNWFRQNDQAVLYWHWSPDKNWIMNMPITGWDEALITYVLAASSNTDSIPQVVYTNGWAQNGAMKNSGTYYGITLPLGPSYGGPLFFAHYSFLGIDPHNLSDAYANYWTQDTAHTKINYWYCVHNPKGYNGYSSDCWGLTASDDNNGYDAHSPTNDDGVISPTAALSSLPYTPVESMNALRFFYYKLGDKLWGDYGFYDAFNLTDIWFANSTLAIDQGPIIVMIENYRSGLLWNLFMSCPEIKRGLQRLAFTSPDF